MKRPYVLVALCVFSACSSGTGSDSGVLKGPGELCTVSAECAGGLFCLGGACAENACAQPSDCKGTPPNGCAAWACFSAKCISACDLFDGGPRLDATPFDLGFAADAEALDADMSDQGFALDAEAPDAEEPDLGAIDAGAADAETPDIGAPDTGTPDAGVFMCDSSTRAPNAGELLINEFLADPANTAPDGDANLDGVRDAEDDEFVEIANISNSVLNLQGVVLSDGVQARYTFGTSTVSCGQVIVVFGGGDPNHPNWRSNWVRVSGNNGLALNNTSDTIRIGTSTSTPDDLASVTYGSVAGNDQSVVRNPELSPSGALIQHTSHPNAGGRLFSPGTRVDGSEF